MKISAGLLMYRIKYGPEFFLVHPGGPFWQHKDIGTWSIPKGEVLKGEDFLEAAKREFFEETGIKPIPKAENSSKLGQVKGKFVPLGFVKQTNKIVHAWAFQGDWPGFLLKQNMIEIELKTSGKKIKIPEIDKAVFFKINEAKEKIIPAQREFIDRLMKEIS